MKNNTKFGRKKYDKKVPHGYLEENTLEMHYVYSIDFNFFFCLHSFCALEATEAAFRLDVGYSVFFSQRSFIFCTYLYNFLMHHIWRGCVFKEKKLSTLEKKKHSTHIFNT